MDKYAAFSSAADVTGSPFCKLTAESRFLKWTLGTDSLFKWTLGTDSLFKLTLGTDSLFDPLILGKETLFGELLVVFTNDAEALTLGTESTFGASACTASFFVVTDSFFF